MKSLSVWVNFVGGGWTPWDSFLRGTEEFVREFATIGAEKGYKVTVFHNGDQHGEYKGAAYLDHKDFKSNCDILLIVKQPELLDTNLKAKRVIYYTNEIDDREKLNKRRLEKVEKVIALSYWHKDNLLFDIPRVQVVYHGCYPEVYQNPNKVPNLCLYASSPDRGLQHLRRFWPEIQKAIPSAKLEVAYNGKTDWQMDELYRKAEFLLYPCSGGELYCITALKAQAAGVIPIVIPTMALSETVKYGVKTTLDNFVADTIKTIRDKKFCTQQRELMLKDKWQSHYDTFEQIIQGITWIK